MKKICSMLAVLAIGCGGTTSGDDAGDGDPTASHCDLRSVNETCQEYSNFDEAALPAYEDSCAMNGGVWADTPCSRVGASGGCSSSDPIGDITNWFYEDGPYPDAASVMAACAGSGTFVPP